MSPVSFDANGMPQYEPGRDTFFQEVIANQPTTGQLLGYTGMRGARTIRLGGFSEGADLNYGAVRGFVSNNLNPRSWFRLKSNDYFNSSRKYPGTNLFGKPKEKTAYTPFNIAQQLNEYIPKGVNWLSDTKAGKKLAPDAEKGMGKAFEFLKTDNLIDTGAFSRIGAMGQLRWGAKVNPEGMSKFFGATGNPVSQEAIAGMSNIGRAQAVGMSMEGAVTGRLGGYLSASLGRGNIQGIAGVAKSEGGLASEAALKGAAKYAEHIAPLAEKMVSKGLIEEGGKIGIKAGLSELSGLGIKEGATAGMALVGGELAVGLADIWNPIGWVLTAASIAQIGTAAVGAGAKLTAQAYASQMKGLNRPLYGGVFKDTEASATSRQRGVMAIQNSRLNARSILGNEASGMYAHFG